MQNVKIFDHFIYVIAEYYSANVAKYQFVLGADELYIRIFRYCNVG